MKIKIFAPFLLLIIPFLSIAQHETAPKVETVTPFKNLFQFQNFYLAGQPTLEELEWLKSKGATKVVSLRSESEISEFTGMAFNEEEVVGKLGMEFVHLPVDGQKDYTPEKLEAFARLLNHTDTIVVHCAGAGRVSDFMMAWLIKTQGYSVAEATEVGRQLKFSLPLEKLIGTKVTIVE